MFVFQTYKAPAIDFRTSYLKVATDGVIGLARNVFGHLPTPQQQNEYAKILGANAKSIEASSPEWQSTLGKLSMSWAVFGMQSISDKQTSLNNTKIGAYYAADVTFTDDASLKKGLQDIRGGSPEAVKRINLPNADVVPLSVNGETISYKLVDGANLPDGTKGTKYMFGLVDITKLNADDYAVYQILYKKAALDEATTLALRTGAANLQLPDIAAAAYVETGRSTVALIATMEFKAKGHTLKDLGSGEHVEFTSHNKSTTSICIGDACESYELTAAVLDKLRTDKLVTRNDSQQISDTVGKNYFKMSHSERRKLVNTYFGPGADGAFGNLISNIFSDYLALNFKTAADNSTTFMQNTINFEQGSQQQIGANTDATNIIKKMRKNLDEDGNSGSGFT